MSKKMKKVILLIVEGDCEEELLIKYLRNRFSSHLIQFKVYHGDIFFNERVTKPIKAIIGDTVKEFVKKNKFKMGDIAAVFHILDTDGCFIDDQYVIIDNNQSNNTVYFEESISVQNESQQKYIRKRNKKRSTDIQLMRTAVATVSQIPYRAFYFARHLEHVLFNEPNPAKEMKVFEVETFVEGLSSSIEVFLADYMHWQRKPELARDYKESWSFIEKDVNSLRRGTNVPLLFQYIKELN